MPTEQQETLNSLLSASVEALFPDMDVLKKEELKTKTFYYLLKTPYQENLYSNISLLVCHFNETFIVDIGEKNDEALLRTAVADVTYGFFESYKKNIKNYIIPESVIDKINIFKDIISQSDNKFEFTTLLLEHCQLDTDFIPVLHNFSYLFSDSIKNIFNDWLVEAIPEKTSFYSKKYNSEVELSNYNYNQKSTYDEKSEDIIWSNFKEGLIYQIEEGLSICLSDTIFYQQDPNIDIVFRDILKTRPLLNKAPSEQKIDFSFYEIAIFESKNYWSNNLILDKDISVSKKSLSDNNIHLSNIYDIDRNDLDYTGEVKQSFFQSKNDISDNINYCEKTGLYYLESSFVSTKQQKSYIIAKVENDIVGYISFSSDELRKDSQVKSIDYVVVKRNFRGKGLALELYDKVAKIAIENNFILTNSSYTLSGKKTLPYLKEKVIQNHPALCVIDNDFGDLMNNNYSLYSQIKSFNSYFITQIQRKDRDKPGMLKEFIPEIKSFHKSSVQIIEKAINKEEFFDLFSFIEKKMEDFNILLDKLFIDTETKNIPKQKVFKR